MPFQRLLVAGAEQDHRPVARRHHAVGAEQVEHVIGVAPDGVGRPAPAHDDVEPDRQLHRHVAVLGGAGDLRRPRLPALLRDRRPAEMVHHDLELRHLLRDGRAPIRTAPAFTGMASNASPAAASSLSDSTTLSCSSQRGSGSLLMRWRTPTSLPPRCAAARSPARWRPDRRAAPSRPRRARNRPRCRYRGTLRSRRRPDAAPGPAPCP